MAKNKIFDNALTVLLAFVFIGLIGLDLWTLKTLPLLPIIVLLTTSPLSFLIIKNEQPLIEGVKKSTIVVYLLFISLICCAVIHFTGNSRSESYLAKFFWDGSVKKEREFIESDGEEEAAHYEPRYRFEPSTERGKTITKVISWSLLIGSLSLVYINYR
ncbi:MAG: hypothetical protein JWQ09_4285, partial [Segetibacter sp.]|nr:hypothetical protein [Segetibacter sp.]